MKELTRAINNHLAAEFQASHTYLAMSIWLREKDLAGFPTYMLNKSTEERGHAPTISKSISPACSWRIMNSTTPQAM